MPALLFLLNIPIFFIWLLKEFGFGLFFTCIAYLVLIVFFRSEIYAYPLVSLIVTSFIGRRLNRISKNEIKNLEIDREKIEEELNLLSDEIKSEENANLRIRDSLKNIARLNRVVEDYSQTLSEEDILDSIVGNSFELFKDTNRILLYIVDTEKQELKLVRSRKRDLPFPVKAKKGDVFDRWVLKHRMPLMVEDVYKDFRFPPEELDENFSSIISAPLTSEHKVLGVLRVDAKDKNKFTQSDLRFLDIISDLSSISLQNAILYKKVEELAIHDSLTGLYVHNYFIERLKDDVKSSLRNNMDICLLMLDLDNFKAYNDKYGHTAGDLVLKHISSILRFFVGSGDIISRYGGEEFALLLLNKGKDAGVKIAEDIRQKIDKTPLVLRREKAGLTVSIGVASCPSEEKMAEEFLRLADSRLYKAKENGRNRVWAK